MDFGLTAEQESLRDEVAQFIKENVTPEVMAELESSLEGGRGPNYDAMMQKVADRGWVGISWPKEYGGQGGSRIDQYVVEEEFARVGIGVGAVGFHTHRVLKFDGPAVDRDPAAPQCRGRVAFQPDGRRVTAARPDGDLARGFDGPIAADGQRAFDQDVAFQ